MARFAFVTWDGGGNVPPAVGIAQELVSRGHDVVFVGYEVQRQRLQERGLSFHALRRSGSFDIYATDDPAQRIGGLMANVWASADHLADIPEARASTAADVMVVDFLMQGALAAAARLPGSFAVLAHSSVVGLTPSPGSPMGAARLSATNALRAGSGLPLLTGLPDAWARFPTVVTTIAALDPAAAAADSSVHYVGPIVERLQTEFWVPPWDAGDDRPLVLVSFTTTRLWDQSTRVRNTLEALADEPVKVLVCSSQSTDVGPIPDNTVLRDFVPHGQVLPSAALTVTHGGHGTVAASLAHGVPMVALPNPVADQPYLANRIQALGAGLAIDGESLPAAIRGAVREVMATPSYAVAAGALAAAIATAPGAAGAALVLEHLMAVGRSAPA